MTFGDESAGFVELCRFGGFHRTDFLIWGHSLDPRLCPSFLHMPGAFTGELSFTYTAENAEGVQDDAEVRVIVHKLGEEPTLPQIEMVTDGRKMTSLAVQTYRSKLVVMGQK